MMGAGVVKSRRCFTWLKLFWVSLGIAFLLSGPVAALTLSNLPYTTDQNSSVQKAHGFHCRPMFGWDPRLGIYHRHRHEGICENFQRCMKVMYRCNLRMGKGWEPWSYERWGFDNWRFDKCMLDAGCY